MKNRTELAQHFAGLGFTKGAEIGVCDGYYSEVLCQNIPGLQLLCIDGWHIERWKYGEEIARKRLKKYNVTIVKKLSVDAAKDIKDESLDFVFIDGEHSYKSVIEDINTWAPKIRRGGIVSGHDYYKMKSGNDGVIRAVDEYVDKNGYELILTEWDKDNKHEDNRQPSWYFIKKQENSIKNRTELAKYFAELGFKKGAEVGVAKAYYSKVLLDNIPNLELLCIDSWHRRKSRYGNRPIAKKVLSVYPGAKIMQGHSMEIVKEVPDESLDFVFIDADHSYECVKEDICEWAKKVKIGGIVSGHDYFYKPHRSVEVLRAVDEYIAEHGYELKTTDNDKNNPHRDDRQPCWFFIKTGGVT